MVFQGLGKVGGGIPVGDGFHLVLQGDIAIGNANIRANTLHKVLGVGLSYIGNVIARLKFSDTDIVDGRCWVVHRTPVITIPCKNQLVGSRCNGFVDVFGSPVGIAIQGHVAVK